MTKHIEVLILLLTLGASSSAFAGREKVLWSFGNGSDASQECCDIQDNGLLSDPNGNLFGTTFGGGASGLGAAFELMPPSSKGGHWTESVIWSFGRGSDGAHSWTALVRDNGGNLYGTTYQGGTFGLGTVFVLRPPASHGQPWTESVLWDFAGGTADGQYPRGGLVLDSNGNLFGATDQGGLYGSGTLFELSPPLMSGGAWSETILWNFGNGNDGRFPLAPLLIDKLGNLYGTTLTGGANGTGGATSGTAFEVSPPAMAGGEWTELILWSFGSGNDGAEPAAGLIADAASDFFGTTFRGGTAGKGTVFELKPPAGDGAWTESTLWSFGATKSKIEGANPGASLIMDSKGNLYGTTQSGGRFDAAAGGDGTAFKLSPSAKGGWKESVLWDFGKGVDGFYLRSPLIMDEAGNLYGTTLMGGVFSQGTAFKISNKIR